MTDEKINYKSLGFKAGLEVHQQLGTMNKLFCNCSTEMLEKEPRKIIKRKMHPVSSELGEIDAAAQYEFLRNRTFFYQTFRKESCLVDQDDEPPHEINQEALEIALQIALLLKCDIPDEIHVMRKTLIDGSAITGFQRTAIVGLNGSLSYKGKNIPINSVSLEEDASAIVSEENGNVTYRLNRLGIPLVEIGTGLLIGFSPEDVQDIAFNIGMICRSTGKTKRGIGSIRQDVNVSTKLSKRVEIKGVQELGMLSQIIENEVKRQLSLIEIKKELGRKGIKKIVAKPTDVNNLLMDTRNKLLKGVIEGKGTIFAIRLEGFAGILKRELHPEKTFGRELADYVSVFGVKGIIHSDEDLDKYMLREEFDRLYESLGAKQEDAIILVGEFKDKGKVSNLLIQRINQILSGVEKETRAASSNGNTRYSRPLPGAARMYPETDVPPVVVQKEIIERIKKQLPEPWTKKLTRFKTTYNLSDDLAKQILRSDYLELFENIVDAKRVEPSLVANVFVNILKDLEKRGEVKSENISEKQFMELFDSLAKKKVVKEAVPEILKFLAAKPGENVTNAIRDLNLTPMGIDELEKLVKEITSVPGMNFDRAIGLVMSKVRGRVDVQIVIKTVKKNIKG